MFKFILTILLLSAFVAKASDIEQLKALYKQNDLKELEKQFALLDKDERHSIDYLFFDALVEQDGELAVKKYKSFLSAFPNSQYSDDALYRLAMYHYSQGQDYTCRVLLQGFLRTYPQSKHIPDVEFLIAQTFFHERQSDSAAISLQNFMQKYPRSSKVDIAVNDLESLGGLSLDDLQSVVDANCFTIQVGTFNNIEITERVASKLESKFKYVFIYQRNTTEKKFALCIGSFNSKVNAENYAHEFIKSVIDDCTIVSCSDYKKIDR